ncbi:MAG: hypothetical protein KatS3mg044_1398 [Rhodothermaceae bacterium]|nr:MAG: hypothetical protein KatS3mg043_1532 [Rhodothermaceae bacterium]GIV62532.1 MAG: hypothetical protein KatS3mg044_1398 [Rhodothermaceae bacterium]
MPCPHPLEPIYRTTHGAVYRCRGCRWVNICFGPIILAYDTAGLFRFARLIREMASARGNEPACTERCHYLRTPDRQIGFAFTADEVRELDALLDGAAAMLDLEKMLEETLGPPARRPGPS